jgi:hypothetical protein
MSADDKIMTGAYSMTGAEITPTRMRVHRQRQAKMAVNECADNKCTGEDGKYTDDRCTEGDG